MPMIQSLSLMARINGLVFIGLNVLDAWLTRQLMAIGGQEMVWWSTSFNSNMLVKGLLAFIVVGVLIRIGKPDVLWLLNLGISIVASLNIISYLYYLSGRYQWFQ